MIPWRRTLWISFHSLTFVRNMSIPRVVIDTDPGVDDTCAILLALKYHQIGKIKIEGITTVKGNCSALIGARNVGRILEALRVTDIPIHKGNDQALVVVQKDDEISYYHGSDGFNDIPWTKSETFENYLQTEPAFSFIASTINKYPNEVSMLCLGPLTNLALAINTHPSIVTKMKNLYFMGGNYQSQGNTPQAAEFNFSMDPESAFVVLDRIKSIPIYCVPWETCKNDCEISYDWRKDVLGKINSPAVQLLNTIELVDSYGKNFKDLNHWILCDQLIVAAFLDPLLITKVLEIPVTVELAGKHTRGQMIPANLSMVSSLKDATISIIISFNIESLKGFLLENLNF